MNLMLAFKNRLTIKFVAVLISFIFLNDVYAQAPEAFNYQGIALDTKGVPVVLSKISLRISILQRNQTDSVVLQETHSPTTDKYGQFSINIGLGLAVKGKMSGVQFNKYPHYIKSEMDINGGSSFVDMGTTQLLSVPYALNASTAGNYGLVIDSLKNELKNIRLIQKGDSIVLNNNRGFVYVPKFDSISTLFNQLDYLKSGSIKYIRDSIVKIQTGIGIGYNALKRMDTSGVLNSPNIAIGESAGANLTKKSSIYYNVDNVMIGNAAGFSLGSSVQNGASGNLMLGNYTGQNINNLASSNVLLGHSVARFASGVIPNSAKSPQFNSNVGIGTGAFEYTKNSQGNIAIGQGVFGISTDLSRNVALGTFSANAYEGDDNVIIGAEMLKDNNSGGSKNVIIGSSVAKNLKGSGNIILGYKSANDSLFSTINNKLIVANDQTKTPLLLGEFDNKKLTINGDLIVTGKTSFAGTVSNNDSTINVLSKKVDSLLKLLSSVPPRIDSSTLFKVSPVIAKNFLDSTFLPAISFNGSSSYVNVGATNLNTKLSSNNFTIEFWVKTKSQSTNNQTVFSTGRDNSGYLSIQTFINNGKIYFNFLNNSHINLTDYPNDSAWHHVAYVNKDKSTSTIYIDGIERLRSNNLGLGFGPSQKVTIGSNVEGSGIPQDFFNGNIRKVRINRGLSYSANFTPSYTYGKIDSTVVFWDMNDLGTQIKASDSTYNGVLYNGVWIAGKSKMADHFANSLVLGPNKKEFMTKEEPTMASFSSGSSITQESYKGNQANVLGYKEKNSVLALPYTNDFPSYDIPKLKGRNAALYKDEVSVLTTLR